jgi:hypothetical protein
LALWTVCPAPKAPVDLSSVSRTTATDQGEVVSPGGGGAYMIAISASGRLVFCGRLGGRPWPRWCSVFSSQGGQVEQKTLRLRIGSTSFE